MNCSHIRSGHLRVLRIYMPALRGPSWLQQLRVRAFSLVSEYVVNIPSLAAIGCSAYYATLSHLYKLINALCERRELLRIPYMAVLFFAPLHWSCTHMTGASSSCASQSQRQLGDDVKFLHDMKKQLVISQFLLFSFSNGNVQFQ